ncbi:DUF4184 family protein [Microbacterium sp. BG28]|uniref:DUF4184 family protein n=1 Tax=Microbacterium sp. BG28 TaxID=3097356 RepID=UPI002A59C8D8|nr:DUF4184 family protein [Microbacterium sp. BG28]MDY0830650.1 DUF4184 family protein [Microbacterium sp. BG28]
MPFTPSHAVAALPFVRTPLVPAAIAVGAMTPDLPLFVRGLPVTYGLTHDLRWLPVTMLVALALLLLWRALLRPAARELAPGPIAERLPAGWDAPARTIWRETFGVSAGAVLLLVASLAIGVASHIAWDAFTHEGRLGSQIFPALEQQWGPLVGIKWLQHGSSAIGLVIIAVWALLWLRRRPRVPYAPRTPRWVGAVWVTALPAVLIAAWGIGLAVYGPLTSEFAVAHLAYRVLPQACAVWAVGTLVLCAVVVRRRSRGIATR